MKNDPYKLCMSCGLIYHPIDDVWSRPGTYARLPSSSHGVCKNKTCELDLLIKMGGTDDVIDMLLRPED